MEARTLRCFFCFSPPSFKQTVRNLPCTCQIWKLVMKEGGGEELRVAISTTTKMMVHRGTGTRDYGTYELLPFYCPARRDSNL